MSEVKNPETIAEQLTEALAAKDALKSFERLESNRDYRKLIKDGFMGTNVIRAVGVSIDVGFEDEEVRQYALGEAQAGQYLKRWILAEKANLRQLVASIPKLEHALTEAQQDESQVELEDEAEDEQE